MANSQYQAKAVVADFNDGNDATYQTLPFGVQAIQSADPSIAKPYKLVSIQPYVRVKADAAGVIGVRLLGVGPKQYLPQQRLAVTTAITTYTLLPFISWGHGVGFTLDDLLNLSIQLLNVSGTSNMRVYELGVYLNYNATPSFTASGSGGPITNTNTPRSQWSISDAESDRQIAFQERIYRRPAGVDACNLAYDNISGITNVAQASMEVGINGWVAVSNCALAQVTTRKHSGTRSMRIRSAAGGPMVFKLNTAYHLVDPFTTYVVMGRIRAETLPKPWQWTVDWLDTTGATISSSSVATFSDAAADPFLLYAGEVTSPVGAVKAVVNGHVLATAAANEDHYLDEYGFFEGTLAQITAWKPGTAGWPGPLSNEVALDYVANNDVAALEALGIEPEYDAVVYSDAAFGEYVRLGVGVYRRFVRVMDAGSLLWTDWYIDSGYSPSGFFDTQVATAKIPKPTVTAVDQGEGTVKLTITPVFGSVATSLQVQRSDDGGVSWGDCVNGEFVYDPGTVNLLDDPFIDANADGAADGMYAATMTAGETVLGTFLGAGFATITRITAGATRQFAMTPHTADDGSPFWERGHTYEIAFILAASHNIVGTKPVITINGMSGGAGDTITAIANPETGPGAVEYRFRYTVGTAAGRQSFHGDILFSYAGFTVVGDFINIGTFIVSEGIESAAVWSARAGAVTFTDRFAPRGVPIRYRVRQVKITGSEASYTDNNTTYGTVEYVSPWTQPAPLTLANDGATYIRAASTSAFDINACLVGTELAGTASESLGVFWTEGRPDAVTIGGTVHSEIVPITVALNDDADWASFKALRALGEPLFFRTLFGDSHLEDLWLRIGPDVVATRLNNSALDGQKRLVSFSGLPAATPA